ncbi:hypothetical protein MFLAVUS_000027 [Mucor flavus]|uniref:Uncharacterized protein n=1 Tax=Mucor flavus TaxID=439312 RepID=A0ABP9YIK0_9FUNG
MQKRNFPYLKDDVKDSCDYLRYKHPAGKTLEEVYFHVLQYEFVTSCDYRRFDNRMLFQEAEMYQR